MCSIVSADPPCVFIIQSFTLHISYGRRVQAGKRDNADAHVTFIEFASGIRELIKHPDLADKINLMVPSHNSNTCRANKCRDPRPF